MLLGNKEKTIRLHAENFLIGNLTFDYGDEPEERLIMQKSSIDLSKLFKQWLREEEKNNNSEEHKKTTNQLYRTILGWRIRGRIKGKIVDIDLETTIEELVKEKATLQGEIKKKDGEILKAFNQLKEFDRQMALAESQIFYLKQGKSGGT